MLTIAGYGGTIVALPGLTSPPVGAVSPTAPRSKHSPSTNKQRPLRDQQPEELSKILDAMKERGLAPRGLTE
jgi:hypothetical protein